MVSPDTAISITFGLISVSISLLGVWISYLTLRAMSLDTGNNNNQLPFVHERILRHEHTHIIAPFARKRAPSMV
ncbi:hypothetical protein NA56DRAFT_647795 [Hyaloscypha hepaticicola]|uniref:Uncharacterized protein n=1 Tax=Hyaloscypha hepaticicola TaxID=2082293 RepID=A0A2J6PX31_9HELO|nr:hypothetical protein NA56DRAFT_647795 [Hyaloscypha hepaticicola]